MKVLIIDDNENITSLLSTFLQSKGFDNVITNDSKDGLELIQEEKYDVVLLDLQMPELSGLDIIKKLEEQKILKDQKIVILSASAYSTKKIDGLLKKDGVQQYLKKPVKLNQLLTAMAS